MFLSKISQALVLVGVLFTSGCSVLNFYSKPAIQGNMVQANKLNTLRVGMSKTQVESHLGSSLLNPMFDSNRIEYAYVKLLKDTPQEPCTLVLYFKQNRLTKIENNYTRKACHF